MCVCVCPSVHTWGDAFKHCNSLKHKRSKPHTSISGGMSLKRKRGHFVGDVFM